MIKSNKAINHYTTDDAFSFLKLLALTVINSGVVPIEINGIVILPKQHFALVTPDRTFTENYQVTPMFYTKAQLDYFFPNTRSVDVDTQPKFTLIVSTVADNQ